MNWRTETVPEQREVECEDSAPSNEQANSLLENQPGWAEPATLADELLPVESFDDVMLPESMRPWVVDIAERLQCPADYPAVSAMVVLAGIVGRKIGIRPQRKTPWLVVPNLWGAVIGRPGLMKTPAMQEPLSVLKRLEIEAKAEYELAVREHDTSLIVAKATQEVRKGELRAAIKDRKGVAKIAAELQSLIPSDPVRHRYLVNDSTVEKLGELLNENPNGLTLFRDELTGFLKSLDREGREGARAFFLEAWNGDGRFTYDRIGRGTLDIPAAIVSIIGAIQPGPLSEYIRKQAAGGAGDDGLLQRFQLAVWPDCPTSWRNVDRYPDTAAKRVAFAMFQRLVDLDAAALSAEREDGEHVPFLRFSEAAQKIFDGWRAELEERLRSGEEHPTVESHLAKFRSLVPSLALLIHLADEPDGGPVTEAALSKAVTWARYLESHASRIYGSIAQPSLGAAHRLAAKIENGSLTDCFTLRDVYRNGWSGLTDRKHVAAAVDVLVDHDWLRAEEPKTEGRPTIIHHINPRIVADAATKR